MYTGNERALPKTRLKQIFGRVEELSQLICVKSHAVGFFGRDVCIRDGAAGNRGTPIAPRFPAGNIAVCTQPRTTDAWMRGIVSSG